MQNVLISHKRDSIEDDPSARLRQNGEVKYCVHVVPTLRNRGWLIDLHLEVAYE